LLTVYLLEDETDFESCLCLYYTILE